MLLLTGYPNDLGAADCRCMSVVALLHNKELYRSSHDNDGMNMQVVLNASIIITDVPMHLGSMHNSFILHMFPLNKLLWMFSPNGGWLIVQPFYHVFLKFTLVTSVYSHYRPGTCSELVLIFLPWWQAVLPFSIPLNRTSRKQPMLSDVVWLNVFLRDSNKISLSRAAEHWQNWW